MFFSTFRLIKSSLSPGTFMLPIGIEISRKCLQNLLLSEEMIHQNNESPIPLIWTQIACRGKQQNVDRKNRKMLQKKRG